MQQEVLIGFRKDGSSWGSHCMGEIYDFHLWELALTLGRGLQHPIWFYRLKCSLRILGLHRLRGRFQDPIPIKQRLVIGEVNHRDLDPIRILVRHGLSCRYGERFQRLENVKKSSNMLNIERSISPTPSMDDKLQGQAKLSLKFSKYMLQISSHIYRFMKLLKQNRSHRTIFAPLARPCVPESS